MPPARWLKTTELQGVTYFPRHGPILYAVTKDMVSYNAQEPMTMGSRMLRRHLFDKKRWFCHSQEQQQQQCIYLKKYKVYNTSCPANSYNANLGRTRL